MSFGAGTNIMGEVVYFTNSEPPVELFEVVEIDSAKNLVRLRSIAKKDVIGGIPSGELSLWHEMGGE